MRLQRHRDTQSTRSIAVIAGIGVTTLVMAACGQGEQAADDGQLTVVASTPVWASVATEVSAGAARVESVIADSGADPHSYESSPRDAATISDADLVVYNGGGYDSFVEQILDNTGEKPTVQAVAASSGGHGHGEHSHEHGGEGSGPDHADHGGHDHGEDSGHSHGEDSGNSHGEGHGRHSHGSEEDSHGHGHGGHDHANEHIWYDPPAVQQTANRIAEELAALQPAKAEHFREGARRFNGRLDQLKHRIDQLAEQYDGKRVIVTEPVAHYLIERAGLDDITPPSFKQAIEGEQDPSAASVAEVRDAVRSGEVATVIYNLQTESPVTEGVRKTAESEGVPVVEMTESPTGESSGKSYSRWMTKQVDALNTALDKS